VSQISDKLFSFIRKRKRFRFKCKLWRERENILNIKYSILREYFCAERNGFAEVSKNLDVTDTDQKIILEHQNDYVGRSKWLPKC